VQRSALLVLLQSVTLSSGLGLGLEVPQRHFFVVLVLILRVSGLVTRTFCSLWQCSMWIMWHWHFWQIRFRLWR